MMLVGGRVLGGEDRRSGGQAVAQGVERGTLFAGDGAGPVERRAFVRFARRPGVGIGFVMNISGAVLPWSDGVFARRAADVVG